MTKKQNYRYASEAELRKAAELALRLHGPALIELARRDRGEETNSGLAVDQYQ